MKCRAWLSLFLAILMLCGSVSAQTVYFRRGFSEPEVIAYAEDAIIMRAGNNECYVNNLRKSLSEIDKSLVAYMKDGAMYAPVQFLLEQLGFQITENQGETITTIYKNQEYRFDFSDDDRL